MINKNIFLSKNIKYGIDANIVSASVRAKLPSYSGSAGNLPTTTVAYYYYRSIHKTSVAVKSPFGVFWNGAINASNGNSPWEQGPIGPQAVKTIRGNILTNLPGTALDQTGATVWPFYFSGLRTGLSRIKDLQYRTRTWLDFIIAGGSVSSDLRTVTIPSGWSVEHDPIFALSLSAGQKYAYQLEDTCPFATAGNPVQCARVGAAAQTTSIGDAQKSSSTGPVIATDSKNVADTVNWATGNVVGASLISVGVAVVSPIVVLGFDTSGTKQVVGVDGDSIFDEKNDTIGDADGVRMGLSRALNTQNYSFIKVAAFSSGMVNQKLYGGNSYRLGLLEYCSAVITNHGHNDAGNLGTDANVKLYMRYHGTLLRNSMKMGSMKRLVRMTITPTSTGAATYNVPASGWTATDTTYTVLDPYLRRTGVYSGVPWQPLLGEPDYILDNYAAHGAVSQGWAAQADTFDGTHPASPSCAAAATYLAPLLSTALGF